MTRAMNRTACLALIGFLCAGTAGAAQIVEGTTGPGSRYGLAMPDTWNGDLIVYAHGIVDPAAPVALPSSQDDFTALRTAWLARGFAVAYSSYSDNGFALKDAVQRLHQLSGLFSGKFGPANRVYVVGHSLGAAAAQMLAEQYPSEYAGSMPMCGLLGGTRAEMKYLGDARVLFDFYFPGVLPGDVITVPDGIIFAPGQPEFQAALNALLGGFIAPGSPTFQFALAAGLPFSSPQEIIQAAMTALGFNLRFTNDLLARTHNHGFYDNYDTIYAGAANAGVRRFTGTADALNYIDHYFTPSGYLSIPTLTLHTTRDPAIPLFHEAIYTSAVSHTGADGWLVQRTVNRFGHCAFTNDEVLSSFDALVAWVTTGSKPQGGPVQP